MLRRGFAVLLVMLAALSATASLAGPASAAPDDALEVPGPVVVLGMTGLRWEDLSSEAPALNALLANGSVAALSTRSVQITSCPADGWLGLSAGRRADAARTSDGACVAPDVALWPQYVARAAAQPFDAVLGTLADSAQEAGAQVAAVGPGAALALTSGDATAPMTYPVAPAGAEPGTRDAATIVQSLTRATSGGADLIVADLGDIVTQPGEDLNDLGVQRIRGEAVLALDGVLTSALEALPDDATVVVASLADSAPTAALRFAAVVGKDAGGGFVPESLLHSPSTRQDGLILTGDLTATLLPWLGAKTPTTVDGALLTPARAGMDVADRYQYVLDLSLRASSLQQGAVPFWLVVGTILLTLLVVSVVLVRRADQLPRAALRTPLLRAVEALALAASAIPAATVASAVVPWWRDGPGPNATFALGGVVVALAVAAAAIALMGPWRRYRLGPVTVIAVLTVLVLVLDVALGSPWSVSTLMGGDPLTAGRFYGFGNPIFAVFAVAALLIALAAANALLARGRPALAAAAVLGIGLLAAVIDVLPALGSDVGGAPALIPAFAWLALTTSGRRITWRTLLLIGGATLALVVGVAVADWLRPVESRSHLGRYVQTVLDGGGGNVILRKLEQNFGAFVAMPATLLGPVAIGLLAWVLIRPARFGITVLENAYREIPLLRQCVIASGIIGVLGFFANDTGLSIPPAQALIGVPALLAIAVRVVLRGPDLPPSARARSRQSA